MIKLTCFYLIIQYYYFVFVYLPDVKRMLFKGYMGLNANHEDMTST